MDETRGNESDLYAQVCFKLTLSKRDLAQRYMYITSIIYINVNFVLG